jgi:hypothetical protein
LIRVATIILTIPAALTALVIRLTVWVCWLWLPVLLLPVWVGLVTPLPRLPVIITVSTVIRVLVIVIIRKTRSVNRLIIIIRSSAIVKTVVTVIHPHKIAIVIITCSISQASGINAVGNGAITITYIKIRISITVSSGIYYTAWMHVITASYHRAIDV